MSTPLVVNTLDGTVWTRRAVTPGGLALYSVAGVCQCPEFVMATLPELAEHGIAGVADVLPMPVGLAPVALSEQQIEALVAAGDRVVNDAMHEHLCMCDAWPEKCVSTGNYFMGAWDVSGLDTALPAVLALWEQMRGGELDRLRARVAELEYVAPSPSCTRCYGADAVRFVAQGGATAPCPVCGPLELERLRARVSELEAWKTADEKVQPHREAISTANMHHIARLEQLLRRVRFLHVRHTDSEHCQHDGEPWPCPTLTALDAPVGEVCHPCGCPKRFARHADGCPTLAAESADKLTALLAPTQALREEPHDGPLHHDYRIGRDLPETGGVR